MKKQNKMLATYMDDTGLRPRLVIVSEILDSDGDGIHNEVDVEPSVAPTTFSDIFSEGTTSGKIVGLDPGITIEIMDAPDPAQGVKMLVSGPVDGVAKIKIDGSRSIYKLAPGEYILTAR